MKQTGLGAGLLVDGAEISGDVGSVETIRGGTEPLVVTGLDKSAIERIGGRRDGQITFTAFFNDAAGAAHPTLKTLPTADRYVSYLHRRTTLGSPAAAIAAKQIGYDATRGTDGSFTFAVDAQANGFGLEWGQLLTPGVRVDGGVPTNGASLDHGASTAFGAQAYLFVTAVTATLASINVQESSDNGVGDPFANVTGLDFALTGASTPGAQRKATAAGLTVERYLRVATSGAFTVLSFALVIVRNELATVF